MESKYSSKYDEGNPTSDNSNNLNNNENSDNNNNNNESSKTTEDELANSMGEVSLSDDPKAQQIANGFRINYMNINRNVNMHIKVETLETKKYIHI